MKTYIKTIDGRPVIKTRKQIVINRNGMNIYNPTEEMVLKDGWEEYVPEPTTEPIKSTYDILQEIVLEQYNARTDISNEEALDRALVIYDWEKYISKSLNAGQCVVYNNKVYRARLTHDVYEQYPPSIETASLYEVIVLTASGTADDPIPYTPPMEIFEGKYYTQYDVLYKCTRDSGTALSHDLYDLKGMYVELIER